MKSIVPTLALLVGCGSGTAQLEQQDLSALKERLEELEETVDDQASQLAVLTAQTATLVDDRDALSAELVALDLRVAELEAAGGSGGSGGSGSGGGSDYGDEIATLDLAIGGLEADLADLLAAQPVSASLHERNPPGGNGVLEQVHTDALELEIEHLGPVLVWCYLQDSSATIMRITMTSADGSTVASETWGRTVAGELLLDEESTVFARLTPSAVGMVSVSCEAQITGTADVVDVLAVQLPG